MIVDVNKVTEQRMQKALDALKNGFAKIRTGRAHVGLLDQVMVDYYGNATALKQVANVTLIDARTLGVAPYEKKLLMSIEKAIRDSDLGLNPASVGEMLRVPMPILTEQRRKELIKIVRTEAENGRVAIRNVRRDANQELKTLLKDKHISTDEEHRAQDNIQKLTNKYIAEIDRLLSNKEEELLTV